MADQHYDAAAELQRRSCNHCGMLVEAKPGSEAHISRRSSTDLKWKAERQRGTGRAEPGEGNKDDCRNTREMFGSMCGMADTCRTKASWFEMQCVEAASDQGRTQR